MVTQFRKYALTVRIKDIPKHGLLRAAGTDLHPATGYHSLPNTFFHSAVHLLKSFSASVQINIQSNQNVYLEEIVQNVRDAEMLCMQMQ